MMIPPILKTKATHTKEPETLFKKGTETLDESAQSIGIKAIKVIIALTTC